MGGNVDVQSHTCPEAFVKQHLKQYRATIDCLEILRVLKAGLTNHWRESKVFSKL